MMKGILEDIWSYGDCQNYMIHQRNKTIRSNENMMIRHAGIEVASGHNDVLTPPEQWKSKNSVSDDEASSTRVLGPSDEEEDEDDEDEDSDDDAKVDIANPITDPTIDRAT